MLETTDICTTELTDFEGRMLIISQSAEGIDQDMMHLCQPDNDLMILGSTELDQTSAGINIVMQACAMLVSGTHALLGTFQEDTLLSKKIVHANVALLCQGATAGSNSTCAVVTFSKLLRQLTCLTNTLQAHAGKAWGHMKCTQG